MNHTHQPVYRVLRAGWSDPLDASFSQGARAGNRWNNPDFPALYCCCSERVARAVVLDVFRLYQVDPRDLQPDIQPQLIELSWAGDVVDISSAEGIRRAGFPADYPHGVTKHQTRQAGSAWHSSGAHGVVCRSASLARLTFSKWEGEHQPWSELAVFTLNSPQLPRLLRRRDDLGWFQRT
jgi:RES domain-containing protein